MISDFSFVETNPEKWIHIDKIDSTNRYAMTNSSLSSGAVVTAKSQYAGRGRYGRVWNSNDEGSFLFSCLLDFHGGLKEITPAVQLLPLLAGASLKAALLETIQTNALPFFKKSLSIKWPNDLILIHEKLRGKVAGILTESSFFSDEERLRVVIGIGVNWSGDAPSASDGYAKYPPVSLFQSSFFSTYPPSILTSPLVENLNKRLKQLTGFFQKPSEPVSEPDFINEVRESFYLQGKRVVYQNKSHTVCGIDSSGSLLIERNGTTSAIRDIPQEELPIDQHA